VGSFQSDFNDGTNQVFELEAWRALSSGPSQWILVLHASAEPFRKGSRLGVVASRVDETGRAGTMAQITASFARDSPVRAPAGPARVSHGGYARVLGKVDLSREWLVMGSTAHSTVGVRAEPHRFKPSAKHRSRTSSQQRLVRPPRHASREA